MCWAACPQATQLFYARLSMMLKAEVAGRELRGKEAFAAIYANMGEVADIEGMEDLIVFSWLAEAAQLKAIGLKRNELLASKFGDMSSYDEEEEGRRKLRGAGRLRRAALQPLQAAGPLERPRQPMQAMQPLQARQPLQTKPMQAREAREASQRAREASVREASQWARPRQRVVASDGASSSIRSEPLDEALQ